MGCVTACELNPPGALQQPTICLLTDMWAPLTDMRPTDLGYEVLAILVLRQCLPRRGGRSGRISQRGLSAGAESPWRTRSRASA